MKTNLTFKKSVVFQSWEIKAGYKERQIFIGEIKKIKSGVYALPEAMYPRNEYSEYQFETTFARAKQKVIEWWQDFINYNYQFIKELK